MIIPETMLTLSCTMLSKSFAKICITHSKTIGIYDYSKDGAYIFMDVFLLQSFANVCLTHSRTIKLFDYSRGGAYTVMDDAI